MQPFLYLKDCVCARTYIYIRSSFKDEPIVYIYNTLIWEEEWDNWTKRKQKGGFPGVSVVKNLPVSEADTGWIPDPGRPHMP